MLPVRAEIQTQYFCFVPSRQLFYSLQLRDPPVLPLVTNILKDPVAPEGGFDESAINGHTCKVYGDYGVYGPIASCLHPVLPIYYSILLQVKKSCVTGIL